MRLLGRNLSLILIFILAWVLMVAQGSAGEKRDMGGWEIDSPYNKLYKASELDTFRAEIVKVTEVTPMRGMSPGVAIQVKESDDEIIEVHLCPTWYIDTASIGLKRGERVKIRGVWAEIDGRDVFMASKIKKGDFFVLKVRLTKDGTPFWTMTPEQLAMERDAADSQ